MSTILLRTYLLLGLISHKFVWEWMRIRSQTGKIPVNRTLKVRSVKLLKSMILVGIIVQTLSPESWYEPLLIANDPTVLRFVGTGLFTLGWLVAVAGRVQLGSNWSDIETAGVYREQEVVARGIYRYIRHPIYVGDLLLLLGLELALNSWLVLGVVLLIPFVLRRAVREEEMLKADLLGYDDYCRRSKRFVPFLV